MQIICVGRNYAEHAKELNNPVPDAPVIFMKSDSSLVTGNAPIPFPSFTDDLHFECELVFRLAKGGFDWTVEEAAAAVDGIGIGIDLTARDIQSVLKAKGLPWTLAKSFRNGAPVSEFRPVSEFPDWANIRFRCEINGETRQNGHSADMIFSVPYLLSYVSKFIAWQPGDLFFSGTPAGVGKIHPGDRITAWLETEQLLDFHVG